MDWKIDTRGRQMEYSLEIYGPNRQAIKTFTAAVPFLAIRVGDLLNSKEWGTQLQSSVLRVLTVEHVISENPNAGIDPAGRITHRALVYTESVPDTPETRLNPVR